MAPSTSHVLMYAAWVWAAMAVMLVGLFLVQPHQRKNTRL